MAFCFLLCCLLLFVCRSSVTSEEEPMCTKFMYDKQMIETMVRMEVKMEQWDKERKAFEENVLSTLEQRMKEMEEVFQTQNGKLEKLIADYNVAYDDVRNTTAHMEILAERVNDKPKVAFNAYTTAPGAYPDNKVVIFPNVLLNEGGGYNNTTGIFTAPMSGLYHFHAHVCHTAGKYMVVSIVHGSKQLATTTEYESTEYSCSSVSAPALVNVGENVFIKSSYSGSSLYADSLYRWPSFSGFLVKE